MRSDRRRFVFGACALLAGAVLPAQGAAQAAAQAAALEGAARARGMTTGQLLRRVITDLFADPPPDHR